MNHAKGLGLALMALLALSAALSPAAQATEVTAPTYPANLTAKDVQTEHGKLTRLTIGNGARFIECTVANLTGTITSTKSTRENVTTDAEFQKCFANGLTAVPVIVTMNGCDFTVAPTSTTAATGSVMCSSSESAVAISIYESEAKEKEGVALCKYDIGESGNTGLSAISIASGTVDSVSDLTLGLNVPKIKTLSTAGSAALCGIANGVTGESILKGTLTVTGETSIAVAQGIMMQ